MRLIHSILAAAMSAAILSGCASTGHSDTVDWDHGARRGWLVSRYAPEARGAALPPCLASLPAADYAAHRYVQLRYRQGRLMHYAVAELPPGLPLRDGEQVEFWPADCAAGQLARIGKLLAPERVE